ncbi:hypothetical protein [Pseudogemmobacter sonorensis]|uniref:hypothetical protein n=1 Tax=Pseudogemmobacter sonorensis TaxID=2989681 RepID=UPI0036B8D84D
MREGASRRAILRLLSGMIAVLSGKGALAQRAVDPAALGPDGLPLIFWLIEREDMAGVARLVEAGADLDARGFHRATPVLSAAIIDYWQMVEYLLARGAKAAVTDGRGFTLTWLARNSRVVPGGPYGEALARVRRTLEARGLMREVHHPVRVRELAAAGRWPPDWFRDP